MKSIKNIAIIGSGPISLFEAIYQRKLGHNVVVYDERDQIGGAWGNVKYNENVDVELGCHIWDVDKETYQFIERFIGDSLKTLPYSPKII